MDQLGHVTWIIAIIVCKVNQKLISQIDFEQVYKCFRRFLSKIGHLLCKNRIFCFIGSIVHRIVFLAFSMNLDPIILPVPRLRTLSAFCYVPCPRCQIHRSYTFETFRLKTRHFRNR